VPTSSPYLSLVEASFHPTSQDVTKVYLLVHILVLKTWLIGIIVVDLESPNQGALNLEAGFLIVVL
jgi:hypothetical protein